MTAAAFQATYSDWRIIKGRKVVQVVFELPLENADEAYQALGGMPIAAKEVWCGIARLNGSAVDGGERLGSAARCGKGLNPPSADERKTDPVHRRADTEKTKRRFDEMSPAQQAGMLCQEPAFQRFLRERYRKEWGLIEPRPESEAFVTRAAICVRSLCRVKSRADITSENAEWSSLVLAYRLWQREPEVVPA